MQELFLAAVESHRPEEWDAYLDKACTDEEVRRQVRLLLNAHLEAGSVPGTAAQESGQTAAFQTAAEAPGHVIGSYKLLEQVGEGGMGTVWMAQQTEPVKRLVAVKLIKAGMDSKQVIARFEAERQALALMDHPSIARVLDGGTTRAGRPYFVMELVKGVPLTRYCDEHRLTPKQRLELFIPVCQAVQHAHQKGIIHRDLKPSNVLVALYDGNPVPKIIDFGVAKAAGQALTEKTLVTGFGNIVGTLEYMSPEQAEINQLDIDTRSDIYSLGVLLYELLTGSPPFTKKELEKAGMLEMLRVIREQEPSKPSTKLSTAEGLPTLAANRGTEPAKLTKLVRGELDWIVMKALEKDRSRRYETANGFARDIQRYLADEPVQACPPTAGYRLRKFVRRNKAGLGVAGLVLFLLLLLGGGVGWVARDRAARHRILEQEVIRALTEAEDLSRRDNLSDAVAAVKRAEGLLASGGGSAELERRVGQWRTDLKMANRLEIIRLERLPAEQGAFDDLGTDQRYREAFLGYGLDLETLGPDEAARRIRASAVADTLLAAVYDWMWVCEHLHADSATPLLAIVRRVESDPWRVRLLDALHDGDVEALKAMAQGGVILNQPPQSGLRLGQALFRAREGSRAVEVLRQAQRRHCGDFWLTHELGGILLLLEPPQAEEAVRFIQAALTLRPANAGVHANLGAALLSHGKLTEAEAQCREAIRLQPSCARAHNNLGSVLSRQGKEADAETAYREALRLEPDDAAIRHNLCAALQTQRKWEALEAEYLALFRRRSQNAEYLSDFGLALYHQGKYSEAQNAFREAIRLKPDYSFAHHNLGVVLLEDNKPVDAETELRHALRLRESASSRWNLAKALYDQNKLHEAEAECRTAIHLQPDDADAHYQLGRVLLGQRKFADATTVLQEYLRLKQDSANGRFSLALALNGQGKWSDALVALREAIRLKPDFVDAHVNMGALLCDRAKNYEAAIAAFGEAIRLKPDSVAAYKNLAVALIKQAKYPEAEGACRKAIALAPDDAVAYYHLGDALVLQKKRDAALAAFRKALAIDPSCAEAHCNLGHGLWQQGHFAEALAETRKGHELGSKKPGWRYPSAKWVADRERLCQLDARLPAILRGDDRARDWKELFELADLCTLKGLPVAGARMYQEGLRNVPVRTGLLFSAARAAALAGLDQGQDASALDDGERARWRSQALDWLRADLALWQKNVDVNTAQSRENTRKSLQQRQQEPDLAGLREQAALDRLANAERQAWQRYWADVEVLLQQVGKDQKPR
jgi:serine/threonine protein kinase/Flp pilus assembly protein TadD